MRRYKCLTPAATPVNLGWRIRKFQFPAKQPTYAKLRHQIVARQAMIDSFIDDTLSTSAHLFELPENSSPPSLARRLVARRRRRSRSPGRYSRLSGRVRFAIHLNKGLISGIKKKEKKKKSELPYAVGKAAGSSVPKCISIFVRPGITPEALSYLSFSRLRAFSQHERIGTTLRRTKTPQDAGEVERAIHGGRWSAMRNIRHWCRREKLPF